VTNLCYYCVTSFPVGSIKHERLKDYLVKFFISLNHVVIRIDVASFLLK